MRALLGCFGGLVLGVVVIAAVIVGLYLGWGGKSALFLQEPHSFGCPLLKDGPGTRWFDQTPVELNYPAGMQKVEIELHGGNIKVCPVASGEPLSAVYTVCAKAGTQKQADEHCRFVQTQVRAQEPHLLKIRSYITDRELVEQLPQFFVTVDIELKLPAGTELFAWTSQGDVVITSGTVGKAVLGTHGGSVFQRGVLQAGALTLQADAGMVETDEIHAQEAVFKAGRGDVAHGGALKAVTSVVQIRNGNWRCRNADCQSMDVEIDVGNVEIIETVRGGSWAFDLSDGDIACQSMDVTRANVAVEAGDVSVDRLTGELEVEVEVGNVVIRDGEGKARLEVEVGSVTIHSAALEPELDLAVERGNCTVYLRETASAELDLSAEVGMVDSELPLGVNKTRGAFRAKLGAGTGSVRVHVEAGSAIVRCWDPAK